MRSSAPEPNETNTAPGATGWLMPTWVQSLQDTPSKARSCRSSGALPPWKVTVARLLAATSNGDPVPWGRPPTRKKKNDQQSQQEYQEYIDGYKAARALVLDGKYEGAIQAFRALGHDDSAEVANYVGYAYRKLGDYELSKVWYDRALAADPEHVRTWEYYGLWHLEQGNKLKAHDFLEKVHALCGNTTCQEYVDLKAAIEDGRNSY